MDAGALVIETAFSDAERELAALSQHLCPAVLTGELAQMRHAAQCPVWITHTKPAETELIMTEITRLQRTGHLDAALDIRWLREGQEFEL